VIQIPCPNCGPRNADEFAWTGERTSRPDPDVATLTLWRAYLYERTNPSGWTTESWYHRMGCRRYLVVERNTVTNEIRRCEPAGGGGTRIPAKQPAGARRSGTQVKKARG
jgi:heterotetrameric sarcosine oxidase delta subunit